ncbi:MAG: F0F1 ATP synthase subunit epsilon [Peptococcaceae bacterium]|nr:F0F1 ATP synthase subunit epsilon [Peptococcaceae bacterium]
MAGKFRLKVVAPDGLVLDKDVEFVLVRSEDGDLGILARHTPLLASLEIGVVRYRENGKEHKIAVSGGFLEVADNKVTILANTAETAEQIDVPRAQAAKERAEKRLQERKPGTDIQRAEIALKKALARLKAAQ